MVTSPQYTGKANPTLKPPGDLKEIYQNEYNGPNYDENSNELTLGFNNLPNSLTYCSEPKTYSSVRTGNPHFLAHEGTCMYTSPLTLLRIGAEHLCNRTYTHEFEFEFKYQNEIKFELPKERSVGSLGQCRLSGSGAPVHLRHISVLQRDAMVSR